MLVKITGDHMEPLDQWMHLDVIPRKGDYIPLDDGLSRYVADVVHVITPRVFDPVKCEWKPKNPKKYPWYVQIQTRTGRAPRNTHSVY